MSAAGPVLDDAKRVLAVQLADAAVIRGRLRGYLSAGAIGWAVLSGSVGRTDELGAISLTFSLLALGVLLVIGFLNLFGDSSLTLDIGRSPGQILSMIMSQPSLTEDDVELGLASEISLAITSNDSKVRRLAMVADAALGFLLIELVFLGLTLASLVSSG